MATRLDGPGIAKLETLESALTQIQRVHALVEQMASASRMGHSTVSFGQQIQRAARPIVGLLKPQFGDISDLAASLILVTTRGGEGARIRALREHVGQLRTHIDAAMTRVRKLHTVTDAPDEEVAPDSE